MCEWTYGVGGVVRLFRQSATVSHANATEVFSTQVSVFELPRRPAGVCALSHLHVLVHDDADYKFGAPCALVQPTRNIHDANIVTAANGCTSRI
jgi:hypothetical protein